MIVLLFALTFQTVTATAVADRTAVRLSDSVRLTLTVEGPSPLAVTVPDEWLSAESSANWRARATGPATVMPLAYGRERWTLLLRLDPYTTGDPVPLTLNAVSVRSGTAATAEAKEWPFPAIRVTSELAEVSAEDARPVTGIEEVPTIQARSYTLWVLIVTVIGGIGILIYTRKFGRRGAVTSSPHDVAVHDLQRLVGCRDSSAVAAGLSKTLRSYAKLNYGFPADCKTVREAEIAAFQLLPQDLAAEYISILKVCERTQFDPVPDLGFDSKAMIDRSLTWLQNQSSI